MANPIPSLDVDDDGVVKITSGSRFAAGTKEVMIGTARTDADGGTGARLASFVTDINGTPSEKAYVDGLGGITGTAIQGTALSVGLSSSKVGTPATGTGLSGQSGGAVQHMVHKITADYTAFQTGATTNDVTLWTLPAKTRVLRVVADVTTKFIGGAIATMTMRVGKAANGVDYLGDADVFTAAVTRGDANAELGPAVLSGSYADITWSGTQTVVMRLTSTGANLSALTQGSVTLYIECAVYP